MFRFVVLLRFHKDSLYVRFISSEYPSEFERNSSDSDWWSWIFLWFNLELLTYDDMCIPIIISINDLRNCQRSIVRNNIRSIIVWKALSKLTVFYGWSWNSSSTHSYYCRLAVTWASDSHSRQHSNERTPYKSEATAVHVDEATISFRVSPKRKCNSGATSPAIVAEPMLSMLSSHCLLTMWSINIVLLPRITMTSTRPQCVSLHPSSAQMWITGSRWSGVHITIKTSLITRTC